MAASATWGARVMEASTSKMQSTSSSRPRCAADTADAAAVEGPGALRHGRAGRCKDDGRHVAATQVLLCCYGPKEG